MYNPGHSSRNAMVGLCDDMKRVIYRAYQLLSHFDQGVDMSVIQSIRLEAEQRENIEKGVSWTMDSDHLRMDEDQSGVLAVDVYPWIPGIGTSHDPMHYDILAKRIFHAAQIERVAVKWGGFWQKRDESGVLVPAPDRPHWAKRRLILPSGMV